MEVYSHVIQTLDQSSQGLTVLNLSGPLFIVPFKIAQMNKMKGSVKRFSSRKKS